MEKDGQTYYYHADGLGSIVALTNSTGAKIQSYVYDSFGNFSQDGNINQPFTYTAREFDPETGLYYYRARYYDAKAGRFITKDPIGFRGGINQYTYVQNNPTNWIDPWGNKVYSCIRPLNNVPQFINKYLSPGHGYYGLI